MQCRIKGDRNRTRHGSKSLEKFSKDVHTVTDQNCNRVQNAENEANNCLELCVTSCSVSEGWRGREKEIEAK